MTAYRIVHNIGTPDAERENVRLAAARALYEELLKYYNGKTAQKGS
ncbi:MAG: hypothetical protein NC299_03720 [Lachnospiraceae bacterium]|nr:hypothetical protein [Ruminococcus sp.]MCM1274456.1 hypothetical protein [Lachnospiraceae bacterium]